MVGAYFKLCPINCLSLSHFWLALPIDWRSQWQSMSFVVGVVLCPHIHLAWISGHHSASHQRIECITWFKFGRTCFFFVFIFIFNNSMLLDQPEKLLIYLGYIYDNITATLISISSTALAPCCRPAPGRRHAFLESVAWHLEDHLIWLVKRSLSAP